MNVSTMASDTTKKRTHRVHIVPPTKAGKRGKAKWIEVGSVWPHKKGAGFDVVTQVGRCIPGRIVCMPVKKAEK